MRKHRGTPNPLCAVMGADELVSHLFRMAPDADSIVYAFDILRVDLDGTEAVPSFRPEDLRSLVKLCQVMAFAILDDGWVSDDCRTELTQLWHELDAVTSKWNRGPNGSSHS
ncbi:MAG: hypothetical protein R3C28_32515 [Pirellulaceae bacterium]